MSIQNFNNHRRFVPLYHYVSSFLWLAILIGAIVNLVNSAKENVYSASLILALTILVGLVWWFSRSFALKAQDRIIRAEENFRHLIATGKPLPSQLRMNQIIALRFASDEEWLHLIAKALDEKLNQQQIKKAIVNWKADHYRV
jgi:hypothetical protein